MVFHLHAEELSGYVIIKLQQTFSLLCNLSSFLSLQISSNFLNHFFHYDYNFKFTSISFFFFRLLPLSLRHFRQISPSVLIRTCAVSDVEVAGRRVKTSVSLRRATCRGGHVEAVCPFHLKWLTHSYILLVNIQCSQAHRMPLAMRGNTNFSKQSSTAPKWNFYVQEEQTLQ